MATEITLTLNGASTNYTLSTGARGPAGPAGTVEAVEVGDITPVSSGKLIGRHGGGSGAAQEIGLDGGLEFQGANIRREALTGDVTASAGSNSTTIANDAVTNAKLANMATQTIKGRTTAGTGDPEDLTATQARSVLGLGTAALANTGTAQDEVVLRGANGAISTSLSGGTILTTGQNGHIGTIDPTSYIQTRLTFRFFNGTQVTTLRANATGSDKVIDFPDRSGTVALTSGAQTISDAQTFSGAVAFTSTTRPTSSGTGTPADNSLITAADRRTLEVENMTNVYVRQQMGWEAGPWATVGASGAYTLDGNSVAGCRFIGTTALASASAQGGGIKYTDGGISGGAMTALNRTWQMRFLFRNSIANVTTATSFFVGLRNSTDFWSNSSIGLYHVPQPANSWAAATAYSQGDRIDVSGIVHICSTAGTSGGSIPSFTTTLNGTTADNTVTWRNLGPHTSNNWQLAIVSSIGVITLTDTTVAWVTGQTNTTLLYLRSDGTNIYASVNGSAEVSVARGALTAATPYIMTRGDTGGTTAHRLAGLLFTFSTPTQ